MYYTGGRGFVYVSTGKEEILISSILIKIRYDPGRPPKVLATGRKKEIIMTNKTGNFETC